MTLGMLGGVDVTVIGFVEVVTQVPSAELGVQLFSGAKSRHT